MKNLVILGAGTAGTMMANRLVKLLPEWRITIADRDDRHVYQPGLLFVPFGGYDPAALVRPRRRFLPPGVELRISEIAAIDPEKRRVEFGDGESIPYDLLVVATGTQIAPHRTPGLAETGFEFYTVEGATRLRDRLAKWPGGRLVVNAVDMPIKCPVAPLEWTFLADAFFAEHGLRERVELVYATPLEGAFTKPIASRLLGDMLSTRNIEVVTDFGTERVAGDRLVAYDGREEAFDLLVSIPLHEGAKFLQGSPLADELGFVPVDRATLAHPRFDGVFALGDATDLPTSKAGSVAHFQSEVLAENVARYAADRPLLEGFDGHANCFIETGRGKAMLIDFNYETEPLPGKFPLPGVGPFDLLAESATNHWGKLAFKWIYWNLLITGKELPIDHRMTMAGKWS